MLDTVAEMFVGCVNRRLDESRSAAELEPAAAAKRNRAHGAAKRRRCIYVLRSGRVGAARIREGHHACAVPRGHPVYRYPSSRYRCLHSPPSSKNAGGDVSPAPRIARIRLMIPQTKRHRIWQQFIRSGARVRVAPRCQRAPGGPQRRSVIAPVSAPPTYIRSQSNGNGRASLCESSHRRAGR